MPTPASNPSLYGQPRLKSKSKSEAPSASNLAFTTTLSSLISKDALENSSSNRRTSRPHSSRSKNNGTKTDDLLLTRPNKGIQKRAAADLRDGDDNYATTTVQTHQRSQDIGNVDAATLHRSKRRMEEKARIYDDLKNGLFLAGDSDSDEHDNMEVGGDANAAYISRLRRKEREGLIDFDRKWADAERAKGGSDGEGEDDESDDDENASIISYEDELGRTRRGTRKQATRAAMLKRQMEDSSEQNSAERWRPNRPDNLIYGVTVQSEAFNPSASAASKMAYLATRRDRSPTPEETHYDADAEVRNRGTGFYAFSKDEELRKKQMEELMNAREETQRERNVRRERQVERERIRENRRKEVEKLRAKRRAEMFLSGLGDIGVTG